LLATARHAVVSGQQYATQAAGTITAVTDGSNATEPSHVLGCLATARTGLATLLATLDGVDRHLQQYLAAIGATTAASTPGASAPAARPVQATPPPPVVSPERIESLRAQLPPPVVPNSGQKTHGRWVGSDGVAHEIVSGRDENSVAAWDILRSRGMATRTEPMSITHVEQKLAAHMVRTATQHATIVINNRPCRGRSSCDTFVPVILPPGYSLTVHAPNYRKTFTGGATPSWR
jgi:hypothetical protein